MKPTFTAIEGLCNQCAIYLRNLGYSEITRIDVTWHHRTEQWELQVNANDEFFGDEAHQGYWYTYQQDFEDLWPDFKAHYNTTLEERELRALAGIVAQASEIQNSLESAAAKSFAEGFAASLSEIRNLLSSK